MTDWGADSEYGVLHDVLLGPPDNFRWLPTSAISKATLESGAVFDRAAALAQHDELVAAYEGAGVTVHMLEPDPDLPYQVFARDSSVMTPGGAVVTQPAQQWRRGEYAPVIRFYQGADIPIWEMITAGSLEGGDVTIVEPGCLLIGNGEERTQIQAAEQLAGWMRAEGWEVRIEPIPGQFVHIDVLVSILAPKLAAVCVEAASGGLTAWLRGKGFEILEVSGEDAFRLGVNAMSLGSDRVISTRHSEHLNAAMRARGLEVLDPDLSAFTAGGGGAHCLAQALRREPGLAVPGVDSRRVIADLRELARRTSDERGAQRLCWTDTWRDARAFLGELLGEIGVEPEMDEAGNLWARLEGADPKSPALAVGSHIDSVPDGGWLDGALGVMAAVGILRAHTGGESPQRSLVLVDWADEEGARFGRSLFGSSAFAGTLDPEAVRDLADAEGRALPEVLAGHGVDLDRALDAGSRRDGIGAYLELHIEQGPRMEASGTRAAAVTGCVGVERVRFTFSGQASHAGTTPMELRRDAGLAAAAAALTIERVPGIEGGVATTGELRLRPGIPTAVAGEATLSVDLRNADAAALARMLDSSRAACETAAEERHLGLHETPVWRIDPIPFDSELVGAAREACAEVAGEPAELQSGALHDAAEVARVLPAAMMFCPSKQGISHAKEEDTDEADLAVAIEAFGLLASRVLAFR